MDLKIIDATLDAIEATGTPTREQILHIEKFILGCPQVETPTRHYFSPGIYAREMFIPAGTVLTGAVHKTEHLVQFVGDITVLTNGGMERLTGRHTFVSKPGVKRVGYAHADTWCTGFFATEKTDIEELENDLVEDAHLLQGRAPAIAQTQELILEPTCLECQQPQPQ
jgi:hypothetical protein